MTKRMLTFDQNEKKKKKGKRKKADFWPFTLFSAMERQKSTLAKNNNMSDDVRTSGVGSIPLDLIPEILKDLPVKTLARFLCVSKPWGMHHSQPRFREMAVKTLARF